MVREVIDPLRTAPTSRSSGGDDDNEGNWLKMIGCETRLGTTPGRSALSLQDVDEFVMMRTTSQGYHFGLKKQGRDE